MKPHPAERGFVLLTALWLLLLCGSIVAFMMLRSSGERRSVRDQAQAVQSMFDMDSVVATIVTDLMLKGPSSRWAQIPAQGSVQVGGSSFDVKITDERGRLDLNSGNIATIRQALQGLGVANTNRDKLLSQLEAYRKEGKMISNSAQADHLLGGVAGACLSNWFTIYSGLSEPNPAYVDEVLAKALAIPKGQSFGEPVRPGSALRIEIRSPLGQYRSVIVRLSGAPAGFDTLAVEASQCVESIG